MQTENDTDFTLKIKRVLDESVLPSKKSFLDVGYDLTLVKLLKVENGVYYYDTGIQIEPEFPYYCEVIARSSLGKTGWMLSNNVGIIDPNYRGNIIVALVKVVENAKDLEIPARVAQLIPRKLYNARIIEAEVLSETERRDTGGLGSQQFHVTNGLRPRAALQLGQSRKEP